MQTDSENPKSRGGRRRGAGRPAKCDNVATISLRIPHDIAEILSHQTNRSAYIIEAIRAYAARSSDRE